MNQTVSQLALPLLSGLILAGCTQTQTKPGPNASVSRSPQTVMVGVARQAQSCWFKKKNPSFKRYKMASELDSYSGKPRILIVPSNNPGGLPKLVAQAERIKGRTVFTTFGPLLQSKNGPKLNASLRAWARGSKSC